MEIIIALVVVILGTAIYFNRKKSASAETPVEAPYKVEVSAPPPAPVVEVATTPAPVEAAPAVAKAPAKPKKPAAPKKPVAPKKPAVKKPTAAKKAVK